MLMPTTAGEPLPLGASWMAEDVADSPKARIAGVEAFMNYLSTATIGLVGRWPQEQKGGRKCRYIEIETDWRIG